MPEPRRSAAAVAMVLASAHPAWSCPVCFTAANETVLYTYYLTAAAMTALPLLLVGSFTGWLYYAFKRAPRRPDRLPGERSREDASDLRSQR